VRQNIDRKSAEAEKTLEFVSAQLPEVKQRLEKAEEALNVYRAKHRTIDLPLENKAAIERSVEIEKAASQLAMQKAELTQRFTDEHPFVAGAKKKIAEVEAERARLNSYIQNLPESALHSVRLLRDVKVANELYVILLNKAEELRVIKSGTIGNVRILDTAVAPLRPFQPTLGQALTLSLALGLLLGVVAAFARRALNRGIEDPDVVESATGLSVYASIPHSEEERRYRELAVKRATSAPTILAKRDPTDVAVESLRSLRTSLQFVLMDAPRRVIALSGPSPGIGKSFVASNLAQVVADSGRRVLLVDADLRNGSLHRLFGVAREPGLSNVIAGNNEFERTLHRASDGLDLLSSGTLPPNPSELLMSLRFRELIERASRDYDLVVIDTPPILAVTDGALIGRLAGATVLVLRAGKHPLREITLTLKRFAQGGVRPTGIVFNDVRPVSANSGYGYHYHYDYRRPPRDPVAGATP
jgi:tyrosine-protein kinase Etk/Wzc